jgi:phosphate transport system substrate-binding protein
MEKKFFFHQLSSIPRTLFLSFRVASFFTMCIIIAGLALSSCAGETSTNQKLSGTLVTAGSTALQPLASKSGEAFVKIHPEVKVEVYAGGSISGIRSVAAQERISDKDWQSIGLPPKSKVDIGRSDVFANPSDYPNPDLIDHLICVIPFTMILNSKVVGISSLTTQQIIDIYTGTITNWSKVGGPNLAILPIVRPDTSGTRATFRKYILGGRDEKGKLLTSDSSQTVRDTVAQNDGAIGYLALSYVDSSVKVVNIDGKAPTLEGISSGYPYWSYGHMFTIGDDDDNPLASAFISYIKSKDNQKLLQSLGYFPVEAVNTITNSANSSPSAYFLSEGENRRIHG